MDQRGAHRFPTELEADCRSCNHSWTSRLCNISTTGCMIVCPEPGLPGDALLRLRLRGLTAIDGKIIWQHKGHAGIRFLSPLHQAVLDHLGLFVREDTVSVLHAVLQEPEPIRRSATALHGQLVKRTWQDEPAPRLVNTG